MDCKKIQHLINDLGDGRLSEAVAHEVQRHVRECTDCRVAQQRALRLQQVLAIKRHETPGAHYFDNFLGDFQRRLAIATTPQPTLWQRLGERLHIQPVLTMRYSFAHALGVVFAVTLIWRGISTSDLPAKLEQQAGLDLAPTLASSSLPAPHSTPRMIASALPARSTEPTSAGSALVIPMAVRDAFTAPRYVLDRFNVTPASYEGADIHF